MVHPQLPEQRYGPPTAPSRRARVPAAAWPVVVLVAALAVAVAVAWLTYRVAMTGSDGLDWAALGALLLAGAVGCFVFAAAYVVGVVLAARRVFPPGRRLLPAMVALGLPTLLAGFVALATALTPVPIWRPVYSVAALAGMAAGPAAFGWAGTKPGRWRLTVGLAGVLVFVVTGAVGSTALARADTARAADALPLALFDGRTADAPFAGWRRDVFSVNRISAGAAPFVGGEQVYLKYFTGHGVVFVTMHSHAGACVDDQDYTCQVVGDVDGNELRHYERRSSYGSYPQAVLVDAVVDRDGKALSVQSPDTSSRSPQGYPGPRQVLERLALVDRATFDSVTGAPLRAR